MPTDKVLKAGPKFEDRTRPGVFLGYYMASGGIWHNEYLCALISDFQEAGFYTHPDDVFIYRTREVLFTHNEPVVFPLRVCADKARAHLPGSWGHGAARAAPQSTGESRPPRVRTSASAACSA